MVHIKSISLIAMELPYDTCNDSSYVPNFHCPSLKCVGISFQNGNIPCQNLPTFVGIDDRQDLGFFLPKTSAVMGNDGIEIDTVPRAQQVFPSVVREFIRPFKNVDEFFTFVGKDTFFSEDGQNNVGFHILSNLRVCQCFIMETV